MGLEAVSAAPPPAPTGETGAPAPGSVAPLSAEQRSKAAERARKSRALKKLKGAKSEVQLKELAAEVAGSGEPEAPSWPSKLEIMSAAGEIAPLLAQGAAELVGTPWELSEKKLQVLTFSLAPAAAQAVKSTDVSSIGKYVPPWLVALAGLAFVFGPPTYREIRAAMDGQPSPTPKPKEPDAAP